MPGDSTTASAFGQTLHFITSIKLKEVERQRDAFSKHATKVLSDAASTENGLDRVSVLLEGVKAWPGLSSASSSGHNIANIDRWLTQARNDPNIAPEQIVEWNNILETLLRQTVTRFDYAQLFGKLLTEWLGSGDSQATDTLAPSSTDGSTAPSSSAPSREEMKVERDKIKELIFEAKGMDTNAIEEYVSSLFSGPDAAAALAEVRRSLEAFDKDLKEQRVSTDDLDWLIKSLLSRDLLNAEKAATVKGFLGSDVILQEVASVLNMQLDSLDTWEWPEEGVYVEMRRHLSGKYRAYMDNEIITALLFQYIGMKWSTTASSAFRSVVNSRAWKRDALSLSRRQLQRRQEQLSDPAAPPAPPRGMRGVRGRGGNRNVGSRFSDENTPAWAGMAHDSIEAERRNLQAEHFFMTQLPKDLYAEDTYDAEPRPGEDKRVSASHAQQIMLRLVSTEAHLQRVLHGQFTIMRADLEWFGPSLPHDSILTMLKFFGLPDRWLAFFKKWLSATLRFDKNAPPQMRKRGVPIAHCLSVLCGEAVLFGMDFAVNQRTGMYMYRIYDDFWFWHHDSKKCAEAWDEMQCYAKLVGITFNMKKTGGACVGGELDPSLPTGTVGWGLLEFDAGQGRFVVSQTGVDMHIAEMRHQLAATKSVFGFANAYNQYLGFMRRQFGEPAHCFGRAHADEIVRSIERIQNELFAETNGSVVKRLQVMIEERFDIKNVPFGWFFFPIARGGLEVHNPTVDYLVLRDDLQAKPEDHFTKELDKDKEQYAKHLETWKTNAAASGGGQGEDEFMSFEEYLLGRETHIPSWGEAYRTLQELPSESHLVLPAKVSAELGPYMGVSPYERWIAALYAEELFKRFGTLTIVESGLIPVGMVSVFKDAKVSWDS